MAELPLQLNHAELLNPVALEELVRPVSPDQRNDKKELAPKVPATAVKLNELQSFLLFAKILFIFLGNAGSLALRERVKSLIKDGVAKHRQTGTASTRLVEKLRSMLKQELGLRTFGRIQHATHVYCQQRGIVFCKV